MKTISKYTCPKCNVNKELKLLLAKQGEYQNQYFYTCTTNNCRMYLNTHLNTIHNFKNLINIMKGRTKQLN